MAVIGSVYRGEVRINAEEVRKVVEANVQRTFLLTEIKWLLPVARLNLTLVQGEFFVRLAESREADRVGVFALPPSVIHRASQKREVYTVACIHTVVGPQFLTIL